MPALINRLSEVCLLINSAELNAVEAVARMGDYDDLPRQRWEFVDQGDGTFDVRNEASGLSLMPDPADPDAESAVVVQGVFDGSPHHRWRQVFVNGGFFRLDNVGSGKSLSVHPYRAAWRGNRAFQLDDAGLPTQHWQEGGDTALNRFFFGEFTFDGQISPEQVCVLHKCYRHAVAFAQQCGHLTAPERLALFDAFDRQVATGVNTNPNQNASAVVNGSLIRVNFGNLFPLGESEIVRTLLHEMMHVAGFDHPARTGNDQPGDGGPYYGSAPLRAELCVFGIQTALGGVNGHAAACHPAGGEYAIG